MSPRPSSTFDPDSRGLLLELPVPFRREGAGLFVERQALNGLWRWSEHFEPITVCAPVVESSTDEGSVEFVDPKSLLRDRRIKFEPLPLGYHPRDHLRHARTVARRFEALVPAHRYLCFSNIGGLGAWGNVAARVARRLDRPYALWFDWVVHDMPGRPGNARQALKAIFDRAYTTHHTFRAIRGAALGLFHGQTVYDAYAPSAKVSALVHDVHVPAEDAIGAHALTEKAASILVRRDVRIGYVGRCHPMKAPLQWLTAVESAIALLGRDRVTATWLGDGPELEALRTAVATRGLEDCVSAPGFVGDRQALLAFMSEMDVFVFCHVSPESPRCLIESLMRGTPIVGYASAYAQQLVEQHGGGTFVEIGEAEALGAAVARLADERRELAALTTAAATSGTLYNDAAVFAHRSELIKAHLP